jgi:predicted Fe-Mo cluster-binding NifX family protein
MKIAISATGTTLDDDVDPRFGRCQYFIIVDPETMEFEAISNSSAMEAGGAGISAGQMIAAKGVAAVLTGNCGPNAHQVLSSGGINVITGVSGKVKDAIEYYRSGKFKVSPQPNVPDHFGIGANSGMGTGFGMGRGMGRGMGMGMGRGMGRGMGMGMGVGARMTPTSNPAAQPQSRDQEIAELKAQSSMLAQQLSSLQRRIDDLEKKG